MIYIMSNWIRKYDILFGNQQRRIEKRIMEHQLSLIGKYDSLEFKSLPHICQFEIIIQDSIVPGIYD